MLLLHDSWVSGIVAPPDGRARRALIPDLRDFGDSSAPADPAIYVVLLPDNLHDAMGSLHHTIPSVMPSPVFSAYVLLLLLKGACVLLVFQLIMGIEFCE